MSGRFLYQFGLTAAVAILVSLLVSFTLTPMMSARLLRAEGPGRGHGQAAKSRSGFYAVIDAVYTGLLQWSMERRPVVLALAGLVALSSIPLYGLVRQEYVPSDVDEAEFEVGVLAREGTSLASMNQALEAVEGEVRATPGVRLVLSSLGGSFIGGVNQAVLYVRVAPHEERVLSIGRFVKGLVRLDPLEAFRGNYSQRQVMQQVRQRLRAYPDLRTSVRNIQAFNLGSGPWEVATTARPSRNSSCPGRAAAWSGSTTSSGSSMPRARRASIASTASAS